MEKGALVGAWIDTAGRYRGTYVLCSECASIATNGTAAERDVITSRIESALRLAEASPSREAN